MTTTVTVNAHCDSETTVVHVKTIENGECISAQELQDGECRFFDVFDEREIIVKEVQKS